MTNLEEFLNNLAVTDLVNIGSSNYKITNCIAASEESITKVSLCIQTSDGRTISAFLECWGK